MNKYSFNVFWSDEDEGYIVTCPEFPGLSAFGETPEEAVAEGRIALELFIKSYEEDGDPLPEPQVAQRYSGQLRVRLPQTLHRQAALMAAREETSLNQFIVCAVAERVGVHKGAQAVSAPVMREVHKAIDSLTLQHAAAQMTYWKSQHGIREEKMPRSEQSTGTVLGEGTEKRSRLLGQLSTLAQDVPPNVANSAIRSLGGGTGEQTRRAS